MKPSELVEAAKKACKADTEYQLEKVCNVSRAHLSHYKKNARWPDNNHARLLAEAAGLNPIEVIVQLEMSKTEDEATRSAWGKALASMRGSAEPLLLAWTSVGALLVAWHPQCLYGLLTIIPDYGKHPPKMGKSLLWETKSGCYNGPGLRHFVTPKPKTPPFPAAALRWLAGNGGVSWNVVTA